MWELEILMDADSFAFFQSTIALFIEYKAKKNSPDWIWERVRNNVQRLRPHLRGQAAESVRSLPAETLLKVAVDWEELDLLCVSTELNTHIQMLPSSPDINSTPITPRDAAHDPAGSTMSPSVFEENESANSTTSIVSTASSAPSIGDDH